MNDTKTVTVDLTEAEAGHIMMCLTYVLTQFTVTPEEAIAQAKLGRAVAEGFGHEQQRRQYDEFLEFA